MELIKFTSGMSGVGFELTSGSHVFLLIHVRYSLTWIPPKV